ncbi:MULTISPECIES: hypothetical protein [unclassified Spiroplasma]|uniref:hypothetical protein n=1 Tax=unclassified Spiroplasma TaxID=2637901 RepID=UPI0030D24E65
MDTKTIIEICTSIISAMSVIITLGITIYFQFENRKRTIRTELYKELEKIWNKYQFFSYEEKNLLRDYKNEIIGSKQLSVKEMSKQFITHFNSYLWEVNILLSIFNFENKYECSQCRSIIDTKKWDEFTNSLYNRKKIIDWSVIFKFFLVTEKNKLKIMIAICPNCLKNDLK